MVSPTFHRMMPGGGWYVSGCGRLRIRRDHVNVWQLGPFVTSRDGHRIAVEHHLAGQLFPAFAQARDAAALALTLDAQIRPLPDPIAVRRSRPGHYVSVCGSVWFSRNVRGVGPGWHATNSDPYDSLTVTHAPSLRVACQLVAAELKLRGA